MRQSYLQLPAVGEICDKHQEGHPHYHVDADDDCRTDTEQVALVATAGFLLMFSEGLNTQPDQSGATETKSFATLRSIYVQSVNIFTLRYHPI